MTNTKGAGMIGRKGLGVLVGLALLAIGGIGIALAQPANSNYFSSPHSGTDNVLVLNGTWKVDDVAVLATGARMNHELGVHGTTLAAATDLTHAEMVASKIYYVTPKGGIDVDVSDDADFVAADFGMDFIFVVTSAGNSAAGITVTDGASGVLVRKIDAAAGTTCEDITDKIWCTVTAAERVDCVTYCAD